MSWLVHNTHSKSCIVSTLHGNGFGLTSHLCLCHLQASYTSCSVTTGAKRSIRGFGQELQFQWPVLTSVSSLLLISIPLDLSMGKTRGPVFALGPWAQCSDRRQPVPELYDLPCWVMLSLLSFEEFLTARLSFSFCRGTKQRRSNLRQTHSQKSVCQQTWVWSQLHPWYRQLKAVAETAQCRGQGSLCCWKNGTRGNSNNHITQKPRLCFICLQGFFPCSMPLCLTLGCPCFSSHSWKHKGLGAAGRQTCQTMQETGTTAVLGGCWQLAAAA